MTRVRAAAVLIAALAGTPVAAARLCHDARGLYTPCPEAIGHDRLRGRPPVRGTAAIPPAATPHAPETARPTRPPLFTTGRLCRDSKGLATPCPR